MQIAAKLTQNYYKQSEPVYIELQMSNSICQLDMGVAFGSQKLLIDMIVESNLHVDTALESFLSLSYLYKN